MLTIEELSMKYDSILKALNKLGFDSAILFKGFCAAEKHNLYFLVFDQYTLDDEPAPQTSRRLFLRDELFKVLNAECLISTEDSMEEYFQNKLNEKNSVMLYSKLDSSIFLDQLVNVFGFKWIFNNKLKYWTISPEEEERADQAYQQEMNLLKRKDEVESDNENNNSEWQPNFNEEVVWEETTPDFSPSL